MKKHIKHCMKSLFLGGFLFFQTVVLFAANHDDFKPVFVKAHTLPSRVNVNIDNLTVKAINEHGKLAVIPFQIDEYNKVGMPYLVGAGFAIKGVPDVFDSDDELLFLWKDAGKKITDTQSTDNLLYELILQRHGVTKYAYIMTGTERSLDKYVKQSLGRGFCETDQYKLSFNPHNSLEWKSLYYKNQKSSLINSLNFTITGSMLMKAHLDNSNLRPQRTGFKQGAIRSLLQLKTKVVMFGITMMSLNMQAQCYPSHFETFTFAKIPSTARVINNPVVQLALGMNVPEGAEIRTATLGKEAEIINGINETSLNGKAMLRGNWLALDTKQGFAIMTYINIPEGMEKGLSLTTLHQDKKHSAKGFQPEIGYAVNGLPDNKNLKFNFKMIFVDHIGDNAESFVVNYAKPVQVIVH